MNLLLLIIIIVLLVIFVATVLMIDRVITKINKLISLAEDYIIYRAQIHILHEERYANTLTDAERQRNALHRKTTS